MSTETIVSNNQDVISDIINDYDSLNLSITDEGVKLVLEYLSDNWDSVRSHEPEDLVATLESELQKLQSPQCLGRHPVRYAQTYRQTPMCDLACIVVSIILFDEEKAKADPTILLDKLDCSQSILKLPAEEINELRRKLRKTKKESQPEQLGVRLRWRL